MTGASLRGRGQGIAFLRANVGYDGADCLMWPLSRDNHGYALCGFEGRVYKAHRLMCEFVHGPAPEGRNHAAHSCGRGQEGCVHPKHLRWASPKENMEDSVRLGAVIWRGKRPAQILTEEKVAQIMAMKGKASYSVIGPMFGVKPKQIGKIFRGEQWKGGKLGVRGHVAGDPRHPRRRARTDETV